MYYRGGIVPHQRPIRSATLSPLPKRSALTADRLAVRRAAGASLTVPTFRHPFSLNAFEAPAIMRQLNIPALILPGGEDFQVPFQVDFPR